MKYYTSSQLGEILKTSSETVRTCITKGIIKGTKDSKGYWSIPEGEVSKLKKYLESRPRSSQKETKQPIIYLCSAAKEIEPELYQCPKVDWLKIRNKAKICVLCQQSRLAW
jgi:hypothetical protein